MIIYSLTKRKREEIFAEQKNNKFYHPLVDVAQNPKLMTHASVQCVVEDCTLCPSHECKHHEGTLMCVVHKNDCPMCTREHSENRVLLDKEWALHDEFKRDHPISHWWNYREGKKTFPMAIFFFFLLTLLVIQMVIDGPPKEGEQNAVFAFFAALFSAVAALLITAMFGCTLPYFDGHAYDKLCVSYERVKVQ